MKPLVFGECANKAVDSIENVMLVCPANMLFQALSLFNDRGFPPGRQNQGAWRVPACLFRLSVTQNPPEPVPLNRVGAHAVILRAEFHQVLEF